MKDSFLTISLVLGLGLGAVGCEGMALPRALPRCSEGQAMTTDVHGALLCSTVPTPALTITPPQDGCPDGYGLNQTGREFDLSCVDKTMQIDGDVGGDALRQQIATLTARVESLKQTIALLRAMPRNRGEPLYVGSTRTPTTGRISTAGKGGLLAAKALCSAEFGDGAAMCTPFQLTRSVAIGKLKATDRIAPSWIYMPTWHNPKNSSMEPLSGLADNCGGYSTGTDDNGWTGMAVEWGPLASGEVAFRWHGGDEALCSNALPIACCQGGM